MSDANDSEFYKAGTHYCTECVGNRDNHVQGCKVPAQVAAASKPKRRKRTKKQTE